MTEFRLNGETVRVTGEPSTRTLLDWLRERRGLCGTKEGCNEGDCGACTVMVSDADGHRALNACILFLPQLDGKSVRTVEGISGPEGQLHPVQEAMIRHHGSQCGFCTPGFVLSMATAHSNGATDYDDQLAGNLCRCTGYAPILRAAQAAAKAPVPDWIAADRSATSSTTGHPAARETGPTGTTADAAAPFAPDSSDALADWYLKHPEAKLIAGATDIGLWVTKEQRQLGLTAFLGGIDDLRGVTITEQNIQIGAMTRLSELLPVMDQRHPSFATLIRRFGSAQIRNAATIGGNIANGSPIGDTPPALIALGASLQLRRGSERRRIALEDFFLDYGKQDRRPGEFVEAVQIPRQADHLRCHKISKRFDQDISALCGCFNITRDRDLVTDARIAFGGMAGIPKRARQAEAALNGQSWSEATIRRAQAALSQDFTPLSDMRASDAYRRDAAANLLMRVFAESQAQLTNVREVQP